MHACKTQGITGVCPVARSLMINVLDGNVSMSVCLSDCLIVRASHLASTRLVSLGELFPSAGIIDPFILACGIKGIQSCEIID